MFEELLKYRHINTDLKLNRLRIPKTFLKTNQEGVDIFNGIMEEINELEESGKINRVVHTRSGGISYRGKNWQLPMYDLVESYTINGQLKSLELVIITEYTWRFVFAQAYSDKKNDKKKIDGFDCYTKIIEIAHKFGLMQELEKYAINDIEEAKKVKKTIESPKIELVSSDYKDLAFTNVQHIDLNSAHISGMVEFAPKLRPIWEEIYQKKKTSPKGSAERELYKAILTHTWGYFQSSKIGYKYSVLAKAGIAYTNRKIRELTERLRAAGRIPFLYNTDGIWYIGEPFHDIDEGEELGQWKNDHLNCMLRAKSAGSYEFIEDGKYKPVVRGETPLDLIKSRDEWEWGDIYRKEAVVLLYTWNKEERRIESI